MWYKDARAEDSHLISRSATPPDIPLEKLTLRDAAHRTRLSVTTLRRYIRSGRLAAEKTPGRYGPEYTVSLTALEQAGATASEGSGTNGRLGREGLAGESSDGSASGSMTPPRSPSSLTARSFAPELLFREMIPIDLFRELSMKHEQLLVQYGMVRVGGQRMMEYKIEAERLTESLRQAAETAGAERERYVHEVGFLNKHLREAELEIEGKNQEIASLQQKIRILEVISRNAITTESIEHQFLQVFDKRREMEELAATSSDERRRKLAALDEMLKLGFRLRPDPEPTDQ